MTTYKLNQNQTQRSSTLFRSNPVLRRMSKSSARATDSSCATYKGILVKTLYFLAATVAGFALFLLISPMLAFGHHIHSGIFDFYLPQMMVTGVAAIVGIIAPFVAIFAQRTAPVSGTLYTLSQGIIIAAISVFYKGAYSNLIVWAAAITLVIVFAMLLLFTSGKIRATDKFKAVTLTLLLSTIGISILGFIAFLIPATRGFVLVFAGNPIFGVVMSVVFIVIAALFLISNFQVIRETVENNHPKKDEWAVSFGLAFTVIWLYFKVLDLLMRIYSAKS